LCTLYWTGSNRAWDVVIQMLFMFRLLIKYWNVTRQRMRCGYTASAFVLYCTYYIEQVQSTDWDVVILKQSAVYIVHMVLNWWKAETDMRLYCSCLLFILCIQYWIGAKQSPRCGYTDAFFDLYSAKCIELVLRRNWVVVILKLSYVYIVNNVLN